MNDREAWQGGLTNAELLAAFKSKAPISDATDDRLSSFALGIEYGIALAHARQQSGDYVSVPRGLLQRALLNIHYSRRESGSDESATERDLRALLAAAPAQPILERRTPTDWPDGCYVNITDTAAPAQQEPVAWRDFDAKNGKADAPEPPQQSAVPVALDEHDEFMATAAYMTCAYKLPRDPKPSRDWQLFRDGWLSAANVYAGPVAQQSAEPVACHVCVGSYAHVHVGMPIGAKLYAATPVDPLDEEGMRLLRKARDDLQDWTEVESAAPETLKCIAEIDAYLAKAKSVDPAKRELARQLVEHIEMAGELAGTLMQDCAALLKEAYGLC